MDETDFFLLGGFSERWVPGRDGHVDVGKEEGIWGEERGRGVSGWMHCGQVDADITLNPAAGGGQGLGSWGSLYLSPRSAIYRNRLKSTREGHWPFLYPLKRSDLVTP